MLEVKFDESGKIYSHIRNKWLVSTPEEQVRQSYLCILVNEYGYSLEQIKEEENVTGRGSAQARADFIIYKTVQDLKNSNNPLIIVEVKSQNISINEKEFIQGELYARIYNSPFFVTHNGKETKFWRVKKDKSPGYREEIQDIPNANATEVEIKELYSKLKVFKEDELKKALEACHNSIRNNDKLDPAAAFDEIAKILFMKVYAERNLRKEGENVFSLEWVENGEKFIPDYLSVIFEKTKTEFGKSVIFLKEEGIKLKQETIKEIIKQFEKYNLSETSVDTKGIAFEKFLNTTFRGELGQFFTPRPVVDFMINMLNPTENQIVCDPTCGSGGFLIRFFQKVRENILEKLNAEYEEQKKVIEKDEFLTEEQRTEKILQLFNELEKNLDINTFGSKLSNLANNCIFGTDANPRMARVAKMNMIMHGDGHGGIYQHEGFLDVGGIKNNTFDIILTNPPFGMKESRKEILSKFELSKNKTVITTQALFVERCINLLKHGGKMAIVLPNNIFNGSETKEIREFVEERGLILATVSLPIETFLSSNASVSCSLLFFQKFTIEEKENWDNILLESTKFIFETQEQERNNFQATIDKKLDASSFATKEDFKKANIELKKSKKEAHLKIKELDNELEIKAKQRARDLFDYPIFMFDAEFSGITATGESSPKNDLLDALQDYMSYLSGAALESNKSIEVRFKNMHRWDAKSYLYKLNTPFPLVKLGDYIYEHSEKVKLFDFPEETFSILGVTNKEGVYLNMADEGKNFNQPYKKVKAGELTYNPYRVNVGSIGLIPDEYDSFYISPAYVIFGIESSASALLLKEYVYLVLSSNWYNPILRAATSGSVRQNLTFELLSELEIPLPEIEEQERIVSEWLKLKCQEQKLKETLQNFKNEIANIILEKN